MPVSDSFQDIIRNMHETRGHKGEAKTHKKIGDHYYNIPMYAGKAHIANCEKSAEKINVIEESLYSLFYFFLKRTRLS